MWFSSVRRIVMTSIFSQREGTMDWSRIFILDSMVLADLARSANHGREQREGPRRGWF